MKNKKNYMITQREEQNGGILVGRKSYITRRTIMNIEEALKDLFYNNKDFQEESKTDGTLRSYKSRFESGKLRALAALSILDRFGYLIDINKPRKGK